MTDDMRMPKHNQLSCQVRGDYIINRHNQIDQRTRQDTKSIIIK